MIKTEEAKAFKITWTNESEKKEAIEKALKWFRDHEEKRLVKESIIKKSERSKTIAIIIRLP